MTRHIITTIVLIISLNICKAEIIRGIIKDIYGNPIPLAKVLVCGKSTKTYSNKDGFWVLNNVQNNDSIQISHYRFQSRIINIYNTKSIDVILQESPIILTPATITGSKALYIIRNAIKNIENNYLTTNYVQNGLIREKLYYNDTLQYFSDAELQLVGSYLPNYEDRVTTKNIQTYQAKDAPSVSLINSSSIVFDLDEVKVQNKILNIQSLKTHSFTIKEIIEKSDNKYYIIQFKPIKKDKAQYSGEIFVDTKTFAIAYLKINATGLPRNGQATLEIYYNKSNEKYWLATCLVKKIEIKKTSTGNQQWKGDVFAIMNDPIPTTLTNENQQKQLASHNFLNKESNYTKLSMLDSTLSNEIGQLQQIVDTSSKTRSISKREKNATPLYSPNITLLLSGSPILNLYAFNTTYSSINRLAMYRLGNLSNNEMLNTGTQILLNMYLSVPFQAAEAERKLLASCGIKSKYNPTPFNRYLSSYSYGITNSELQQFKSTNMPQYIRLQTLREEVNYATIKNIEEELFLQNIANNAQRDDFIKYYYADLFIRRLLLIVPTLTSAISSSIPPHTKEINQPIFANRIASYVHTMMTPAITTERNISKENLTPKEQRYLRRMRLLCLQNLISPLSVAIPPFNAGNNVVYTFSLGYTPTVLGECFSQNIWIKNSESAYRISLTEYNSNSSIGYGVGIKIINSKLMTKGKLSTQINYWKQPENHSYYSDKYVEGFSVGQAVNYKLGRTNLLLGYLFKTKGYQELSENLGADFSLYFGINYSFYWNK